MHRMGLGRVKTTPGCLLVAGLVIWMSCLQAIADDIRVYGGAGPSVVVSELAAGFEKTSGHKVQLTFAPITELQRRLLAGEKADLLIVPTGVLATLENTITMRPERRPRLASTGINIIIQANAAVPDISSLDSVRKLLLDAPVIAVPPLETPSGSHMLRVIETLGVIDAVRPKLLPRSASAGGGELVANGKADLGFYLLSEALPVAGISLVGPLPQSIQGLVVYGAAIPSDSRSPKPANEFLKYISDSRHSESWRRAGFELEEAH
jgi:molybdate transport system substrate-binding protein